MKKQLVGLLINLTAMVLGPYSWAADESENCETLLLNWNKSDDLADVTLELLRQYRAGIADLDAELVQAEAVVNEKRAAFEEAKANVDRIAADLKERFSLIERVREQIKDKVGAHADENVINLQNEKREADRIAAEKLAELSQARTEVNLVQSKQKELSGAGDLRQIIVAQTLNNAIVPHMREYVAFGLQPGDVRVSSPVETIKKFDEVSVIEFKAVARGTAHKRKMFLISGQLFIRGSRYILELKPLEENQMELAGILTAMFMKTADENDEQFETLRLWVNNRLMRTPEVVGAEIQKRTGSRYFNTLNVKEYTSPKNPWFWVLFSPYFNPSNPRLIEQLHAVWDATPHLEVLFEPPSGEPTFWERAFAPGWAPTHVQGGHPLGTDPYIINYDSYTAGSSIPTTDTGGNGAPSGSHGH